MVSNLPKVKAKSILKYDHVLWLSKHLYIGLIIQHCVHRVQVSVGILVLKVSI